MNRPVFHIGNNDNENTDSNTYLTHAAADVKYYNINQVEKLENDLNLGNNKIINVNSESDVITKTEAEITYAKPLRELIASNKKLLKIIRNL